LCGNFHTRYIGGIFNVYSKSGEDTKKLYEKITKDKGEPWSYRFKFREKEIKGNSTITGKGNLS